MPASRRLIFASSNAGKARELRALVEGSGWTLLLPREASVARLDVPEGGRSYLENAMLKAVTYAKVSGLPALADDSGIEVDALDGRPGVLSARFGGRRAPDDRARWRYLLNLLDGVPPARRGARFRAVIVLALPGGLAYAREGAIEGRITLEARGEGGFGYDPVFELPDGRTMAQLGEEKQRLSHRALAMRAMMEVLNELAAGRPA